MKKDGTICWVAPGSPKCLAVQSADSVPVLIAMGARARLASAAGEREIAVEDLYRNDGIDYRDEAAGRAPDGDPRSRAGGLARRLQEAAPPRVVRLSRCSPWAPRSRLEGGRVAEARLVLGGVASAPIAA